MKNVVLQSTGKGSNDKTVAMHEHFVNVKYCISTGDLDA